MNYDDLITVLRIMGMPRCVEAADAIAALVAERDECNERRSETIAMCEQLRAERDAAVADAGRYRWLRSCLWNQELSPYSTERLWLWSTRFASTASGADGDVDAVTEGQLLDAAIDVRIAEDVLDSARKPTAQGEKQ